MGEPDGAVKMKAELLAHGLRPTEAFLEDYGPPFLEKRRSYGNPDEAVYLDRPVPQELVLLPSGLVCAVNLRAASPWRLDREGGAFVVRREGAARRHEVTFPRRPAFYDQATTGGRPVNSVITLYGGGSLGIFVSGSCSLVEMGAACRYCSIAPNRSRQTGFPSVVTGTMLEEALAVALRDRACPVKQVMINGGNFIDPDRSFLYYAKMAEAARTAIDSVGRGDVDLHLVVYPPLDLRLLELLHPLRLSVAMNAEVYDPERFRAFCPGKDAVLGQAHILNALASAASLLGEGRVFSIFVGGLEPVESLREGMERLAGDGVVPVVNVFHPDPDTALAWRPAPSAAEILGFGSALQAVYRRLPPFQPFYLDCGRNSIDTEAHQGLFQ